MLKTQRTTRRGWWPLVFGCAIFAILSRWAGMASEGFLEADACTHYLYARFALRDHHYFVNMWGRPFVTGIYAVPAAFFGRPGVQVVSLLFAIGCAWIAYAIARKHEMRWPALAGIFVLAQPLVFLHSFSELTELPFAFLLGLTYLACENRKWWAMAALAALLPLARPEGFGFLFIALLLLAWYRKFWPMLVLPLGLIAWDFAGWELYGRSGPVWRWIFDNWPYAAESPYQRGSIFHFMMLLPAVTSPLIFPATLLGAWIALKSRRVIVGQAFLPASGAAASRSEADRNVCPTNTRGLVVVPMIILVVHSLLYATGKMASNGELRYMLTAAVFWAVLAAFGWEWIFTQLRWKFAMSSAVLAALLPCCVLNSHLHIGPIHFGYKVLPLVQYQDWQEGREIATWLKQSGLRQKYPFICASHPSIYYYLDESMSGPTSREWSRDTIDKRQPGTLLIWDPVYGNLNAEEKRMIDLKTIQRAGWKEITTDFGENWRVFVSAD